MDILGLNQIKTSTSSENVNQDNVLVPLDNSAVSNITQQPDNSSEIDAKDLTEKESWKEWTNRQWNDNKRKWIGGISVVAFFIGYYIFRTPAPATLEIFNPSFVGFFQPNAWGEFFIYDDWRR